MTTTTTQVTTAPAQTLDVSLTVGAAWAQLPQAFQDLHTNCVRIGALVVFLLDNDPTARDKFRKAGITPALYTRFEKVGRGTLLPELVDSMMFARLPIDQQKIVVQGGVTAVIEKKDGSFDTIQVDIMRADSRMVTQVVARDHIRSPAEQRVIIERRKVSKAKTKAIAMPWRVQGKTIVFSTGCAMSRSDLLSALRALEA